MMLHEIENMDVAELKAKKDELIEAAANADPKELAVRYVQARLDAKLRDVKLAEQAETLDALRKGIDAVTISRVAAEKTAADVTTAAITARSEADKHRQTYKQRALDMVAKFGDREDKLVVKFGDREDKLVVKFKQREGALLAKNNDLDHVNKDAMALLDVTQQRCQRLKVQAERHAIAISSIAKISADAIAITEIEAADKGVMSSEEAQSS